jgi:hypothetical protein
VVRQENAIPLLKGQQLGLRVNNELSDLQGRCILSGHVELKSASIAFLAVPDAKDESCK